jgi:hypothetical protein
MSLSRCGELLYFLAASGSTHNWPQWSVPRAYQEHTCWIWISPCDIRWKLSAIVVIQICQPALLSLLCTTTAPEHEHSLGLSFRPVFFPPTQSPPPFNTLPATWRHHHNVTTTPRMGHCARGGGRFNLRLTQEHGRLSGI